MHFVSFVKLIIENNIGHSEKKIIVTYDNITSVIFQPVNSLLIHLFQSDIARSSTCALLHFQQFPNQATT